MNYMHKHSSVCHWKKFYIRNIQLTSSFSLLQPSTSGKPPLPSQYSPAALSLKMASELNPLESLEESVRQISEMERTRHVSLAQQESVSLARVLQARQRDHEREIQLLSLKARQEVEEANKQLEVNFCSPKLFISQKYITQLCCLHVVNFLERLKKIIML